MILAQFGRRVGFSPSQERMSLVRMLRSIAVVAAVVLALIACEREEKAVREDLPLARTTKARIDVQTIATAVNTYRVTCGELPDSLEALITKTTVSGVACGPMLGSIPAPPTGWSAYAYTRQGESFTVSSTGGGQTVTAP
jgi:type II secretion system (T2SS) protein G